MKKFLALVFALVLAAAFAVPSLAATAADKATNMSDAAIWSMAINRNFGADAIAIFRAEYLHLKSEGDLNEIILSGAVYYSNLRLQLDLPTAVRSKLVEIDNLLLEARINPDGFNSETVTFLLELREAAYDVAFSLYD